MLSCSLVDYEDAITYLLTFADFERSGRFEERPDLAPVFALLRELGDPQKGRPTVHVTGSKGKGSVAAMIESCLRAARRTTGLFTSPHLHDYTERIAVNAAPVSRDEFALLVERTRDAIEAIGPSLGERRLVTFDLLTAMGFLAFREHEVDVQVIEVGLGGRLDSTNVFDTKDVAVITPISLEHTAVLGDTIEQIAREKAGIIAPGCKVVLAAQPYPDATEVVQDAAASAGATLIDVAGRYSWRVLDRDLRGQTVEIAREDGSIEARIPLIGAHQVENAATAVAAVDALGARTGHRIKDASIAAGLAELRWPCRMEVLRENPLVIADGAHNAASARRLVDALREYGYEHATFVVGSLADKNIAGLAAEIAPLAERVIATRSKHPRAMDPERVAEAFRALGVPVSVSASVREGVDNAMAGTPREGLICLLGSLFVAAEGREYLLGVNPAA